jgi:PAS domain S-box-containing protein
VTQLLGYNRRNGSRTRRWASFAPPDDRSRALAENARHNETGEPFRLEYRLFAKDGHVVWVHDEAMMVRDERGMPRYSHGRESMDISDRKRTRSWAPSRRTTTS